MKTDNSVISMQEIFRLREIALDIAMKQFSNHVANGRMSMEGLLSESEKIYEWLVQPF